MSVSDAMVFLDCEFTSLASPRLVSIGLWPLEAGQPAQTQTCFYGELAGAALDRLAPHMNNFTQDTVLPQLGVLPQAFDTERALGLALSAYLRSLPAGVQVAYDYHADFNLLEALLRTCETWDELGSRLTPTNVAYLNGDDASEQASEAAWQAFFAIHYVDRHHALADAFALRAAFKAMHG